MVLMLALAIFALGGFMTVSSIKRRSDMSRASFIRISQIVENTLNGVLEEEQGLNNHVIEHVVNLSNENTTVAIFSEDMKMLISSSNASNLISELGQKVQIDKIMSTAYKGDPYIITKITSSVKPYVIFIATNIASDQNIGNSQIIFTLSSGLIALSLIWFLTRWFLSKNLIKPINIISTAANQIAQGNLSTQVTVKSGDEMETLANSINTIASRLKGYITQLKTIDKVKDDFITIASHNLRTPVAELKGGIEALSMVEGVDNQLIEQMQKTLKSLDYLSENLLKIVNLESDKSVRVEVAEIDLNKILEESVSIKRSEIDEKKIQLIERFTQEPVLVKVAGAQIIDAVIHIIENAIKFSNESGIVEVSVTRDKKLGMIVVADHGVGVSEEKQKNLFNKFQRGTDLMTYNYEGVGVGLYICKLIVEQHHGTIELTSTIGKGTTVSIILPVVG